jgi:DNA polymerase-3 subunit delta'
MRLCFKASSHTDRILDWVDQIALKNRENQKAFINVVLEVIRECLLINISGQNLLRIREEDKNKLEAFAPFIHENNAEKIITELNKAYGHIERNAHAKILFLDLSMKIHQYLHTKKEELAV